MSLVVGIHGPSGSGKTTLIEQLTPRLTARGLSVGVIKHAHDGFALDQRGKDSQRFWESGAQVVLTAGPDELFVRQQRSWGSLAELLRLLPQGLDCVLIEGFTHTRTTLDAPASVQVEVTPDAVKLNGQRVAREEAAAALEDAIMRCLKHAPVCSG